MNDGIEGTVPETPSGNIDEADSPRPKRAKRTPRENPALFEAFLAARRMLWENHPDRASAKFLEPTMSKATISRLRQSEEKHASSGFEQSTQRRLVVAMLSGGKNNSLYQMLADMIGQLDGERDVILGQYLGEFRYFRYASKGGVEHAILVMGRIVISRDVAGNPKMDHWSHDVDWDGEPEHVGYVFHKGNCLFMAAAAEGVMRLGIGRVMTKRKNYTSGLIVSVRSEPTLDPYAARFVMVPESNSKVIAELSTGLPKSEAAFKRYANYDKTWYMLTH